jgi:hypothetical protein
MTHINLGGTSNFFFKKATKKRDARNEDEDSYSKVFVFNLKLFISFSQP